MYSTELRRSGERLGGRGRAGALTDRALKNKRNKLKNNSYLQQFGPSDTLGLSLAQKKLEFGKFVPIIIKI